MRSTFSGLAAVALLLAACADPGPVRDLPFTSETELLLVEDGSVRYGGARIPPERLPLRELEAWLQANSQARDRIDAMAAGIRRAVVTRVAEDLAREYGVRVRVLEREETERTSFLEELDPRGTFERHSPDGLLVVGVWVREIADESAGGAVLEAAESATLLGPGRKAVSEFHPLVDEAYVECAVRNGDSWVPASEGDCAATLAARVLDAIRAARSAGAE